MCNPWLSIATKEIFGLIENAKTLYRHRAEKKNRRPPFIDLGCHFCSRSSCVSESNMDSRKHVWSTQTWSKFDRSPDLLVQAKLEILL